MFGLSTSHLLLLGLVVLLFGSKRLPELGASLGTGIRAFKSAVDGKSVEELTRSLPEQQARLAKESVPGSDSSGKS